MDHLVFYMIHSYVIYCSWSLLCRTIFCKPTPKFICTISKGSIHFISVLNFKRQPYQCLQNKIPLSSCKVSTFFNVVSFSDDPLPALTFYWCALWLLWRHTIATAAQTFCMLFINQIDLKINLNEHHICLMRCMWRSLSLWWRQITSACRTKVISLYHKLSDLLTQLIRLWCFYYSIIDHIGICTPRGVSAHNLFRFRFRLWEEQ